MTQNNMKNTNSIFRCSICEQEKSLNDLFPALGVLQPILELIGKDHPTWHPDGFICTADIDEYRNRYVQELLKKQKGNLDQLERDIRNKLNAGEYAAKNTDDLEEVLTKGEKIADKVAKFGGSWKFIISFSTIVLSWITINVFLLTRHAFDPFPFILLNLILSCLTALQAPIIMMSQIRQESKDRMRSEHEYQVNLRAELEVRMLHKKMDYLTREWVRLLEIQSMQLQMLEEIKKKKDAT